MKRIGMMCAMVFVVLTWIHVSDAAQSSSPSSNLQKAKEFRAIAYKYQKAGKLEEAVLYYTKATWEDPRNPEYYNDLGIVYETQGKLDKAEISYLTCLSLDQQYLKAHSNLALLYESRGKLEKAIGHLKKRIVYGDKDEVWTQRCKDKLEAMTGCRVTYEELEKAERNQIQLPCTQPDCKVLASGEMQKNSAEYKNLRQGADSDEPVPSKGGSTLLGMLFPKQKITRSSSSPRKNVTKTSETHPVVPGNKGYLYHSNTGENTQR